MYKLLSPPYFKDLKLQRRNFLKRLLFLYKLLFIFLTKKTLLCLFTLIHLFYFAEFSVHPSYQDPHLNPPSPYPDYSGPKSMSYIISLISSCCLYNYIIYIICIIHIIFITFLVSRNYYYTVSLFSSFPYPNLFSEALYLYLYIFEVYYFHFVFCLFIYTHVYREHLWHLVSVISSLYTPYSYKN